MCKVYEFPVKKDIPEYVAEILQESAYDYVRTLNKCVEFLVNEGTTSEEYDELTDKLLQTYLEAIIKAVAEYE